MREKEPSFMRLVAISTWRCTSPEARIAGEARDAEEERRIESFRQKLQHIAVYNTDFDIVINGGCLEAVIDDLRFIAYEITSHKTEEHRTVLTLLGRCPSCGVETVSEPFKDLAGLGKILEEFVPIVHHFCPAPSKTEISKILSSTNNPV
jgi:hypothetical protein